MIESTHSSGITVVGTGEVSARPDRALVDVGVSVREGTVTAATSTAQTKTSSVLAALSGADVDRSDIATTTYSIQPEYDYQEGSQRLLGYRVTNRLRVMIGDTGRIGDVIDRCVAAGGDSVVVDNVAFSVSDESTASSRAREAAWDHAQAKAEHLAALAGRAIGPVASIIESVVRTPGLFPQPGWPPQRRLRSKPATPRWPSLSWSGWSWPRPRRVSPEPG